MCTPKKKKKKVRFQFLSKGFDKEEFVDCSLFSHCSPSLGTQAIFYISVQERHSKDWFELQFEPDRKKKKKKKNTKRKKKKKNRQEAKFRSREI